MVAIPHLLESAIASGVVPGAVTVRAGTGISIDAAGWADAARTRPMAADTVFRIASMTKAVTSVAAMQCVEDGRLSLDDPIEAVLPALTAAPVLDGYDDAGAPRLRPARRPITLRHLLTHTAGFAYTTWNEALFAYRERCPQARPIAGPDVRTSAPLVFDPGAQWAYGTNTDWVGFAIEAVTGRTLGEVFEERILGPLGMADTCFEPPADGRRLVAPNRREADGALVPLDPAGLAPPPFQSGGGGLYSTPADYAAFLRALLEPDAGPRLLSPQSLEEMGRNQIGDHVAGTQPSCEPARSNPMAFFAGTRAKWGLGFLLNPEPVPGGRAAGSLAWGGLFNTYFWIDRTSAVAGALFTQLLPFCDAPVLELLDRFEHAVYADRAAA